MNKKQVLVVDGEIYILQIIEFTLSMEGYDVLSANDGFMALRIVGEAHPDLVVIDAYTPLMDGHEFCRRLRQDDATRDTPVIVLSTAGRHSDCEHAYAAGANMFMVKPFSPRRLVENINELLARPASSQE
jgi:DNA-binding response OmpR family regulator